MKTLCRSLVLAGLLSLVSPLRAAYFSSISVAPACPLAGQTLTVTFSMQVPGWQTSGYAIGLSTDGSGDGGDTWYSADMNGSCPGNGFASPSNAAVGTTSTFAVTKNIVLPSVLPAGPYNLIFLTNFSGGQWLGSCTSNQQSFPINVCYYSPTFTPTPTAPYSPTASPTGVQNVARTTFGPSNWVAFIVVSPTQSPLPGSPSPTPTVSPTRTATVSSTVTATPTPTDTSSATPTPSPTRSPTATSTSTPTSTASASPTPTATITFTRTSTATDTSTSTSTASASPTPTATVTVTATATRTPTASVTISFTSSPTPTPTVTATSTSTRSFTASVTISFTSSPTPTPTDSATLTASPSVTATATQTLTATESITSTSSPTATPTATVTDSSTDSPTLTPSASLTLTSTVTSTPTQTASFSATPSDSSTPSVTLSSTDTPVNTFSDTPSSSPTPSLTITFSDTATSSATPSQTATVTASLTRTPSSTASPSLTLTPSFSQTPTRTASPTITQSFTASPTPIPMPYTLSLQLYNAAGELVRTLYQGDAQFAPTQVLTSQPSLAAGSGSISFLFSGALSGLLEQGSTTGIVWDGRNDNGQLVSGGTYYAKIQATDPFGHVTALVDSVGVIQAAYSQQLNVYNSAGEVVAQVPLTSTAMTSRFEVPEPNKALELDPATGLPMSGFSILLIAENGQQIWTQWNGLNSQGVPVSAGLYTLELLTQQPGQAVQRLDKQVQVLTAPLSLSLGVPVVAPQPYRNGTLSIFFHPLPGNETIHARLYNAAGELVLVGGAHSNGGRLDLDQASKLASGIYVLELTWVRGSAVVERKMSKVAVAR